MTTLIVGCGYLGRRVGRLLIERGERVFGTTRTAAKGEQLEVIGIEPIRADVLEPRSLGTLPEADRCFYCVGFDRSTGTPMRRVYVDGFAQALECLRDRVGRLVYASSTGVYGQCDGSWVDEDSPTEPEGESGIVALEAERLASRSVVLRFAGLYGPDRIIGRMSLQRGEPIAGDPEAFLNLIHVDDAARVAVAALDRGEPGCVYLVADDRPVTRREYYERAAESLDAPPPRFERLGGSNKRASNRRVRQELGIDLRYPDITTGLPAALGARHPPSDRGTAP